MEARDTAELGQLPRTVPLCGGVSGWGGAKSVGGEGERGGGGERTRARRGCGSTYVQMDMSLCSCVYGLPA